MLLDFDIPKSEHGVEKQRLATHIVTSPNFIKHASQKVEKELANEAPYVYTHKEREEITKTPESSLVRRKVLFCPKNLISK